MNSSLEQLKDDEFISRLMGVATSDALYDILTYQDAVKEAASMIPFISFDELTAFVHSIPVEKGKHSFYDITFAALAVALEDHHVHGRANTNADFKRFAEDFLIGLSGLDIAELPLATRVAKIIMKKKYGTVN